MPLRPKKIFNFQTKKPHSTAATRKRSALSTTNRK